MDVSLAPGVFAADVRGDLVFLDAPKDEYLCLSRSAAAALRRSHADSEGQDLIDELVAAGLLVAAAGATAELFPKSAPALARHDLGQPGATPKAGAGQIVLFVIAVFATAARLRLGKPSRWLRKRAAGPSSASEADVGRACKLARLFHVLRPWVPRSARCLPSSILLLEFLKLNGIGADWIFGVRTHPFEAHCWVEIDGIVLNDSLEHTGWFTPIAAA